MGNVRAPPRYSLYAELMFTVLIAASDVIESEPSNYLEA